MHELLTCSAKEKKTNKHKKPKQQKNSRIEELLEFLEYYHLPFFFLHQIDYTRDEI